MIIKEFIKIQIEKAEIKLTETQLAYHIDSWENGHDVGRRNAFRDVLRYLEKNEEINTEIDDIKENEDEIIK